MPSCNNCKYKDVCRHFDEIKIESTQLFKTTKNVIRHVSTLALTDILNTHKINNRKDEIFDKIGKICKYYVKGVEDKK